MRSVCIVGFASQTRELVNQEPPSVERWGLNTGHEFMKEPTRWFQLHPRDWKGRESQPNQPYGRSQEHLTWLQTCGIPVYMRDKPADIPTAVVYPFDDVVKSLGAQYFTSSVSYMLGLAIHEKVDEIKLYGVHLSATLEYYYQRACIEWMLGKADGMGIKVTLPANCPLLRAPTYAREENDLQNVALMKLQGWKARYMQAWGEWYAYVGAWQEALDPSRKQWLRQVIEAKVADVNGCAGAIKAEMAWLAGFGGVDVLAPELPRVNMPEQIKELVPEPLPVSA